MAYCGPRGIPYDEWLGLGSGWTERSRLAALTWQAREAQRCGSCGQVNADWVDDDGHELRTPPFEVVRHRCLGCDALALRRADDGEGKRDPALHDAFQRVAASEP